MYVCFGVETDERYDIGLSISIRSETMICGHITSWRICRRAGGVDTIATVIPDLLVCANDRYLPKLAAQKRRIDTGQQLASTSPKLAGQSM